jgi:hypothetical protein
MKQLIVRYNKQKGMMKKLLLLLAITCLSAAGFAQSGTTGGCTWAITGSFDDYTLTISGNGKMKNYHAIGVLNTPWFLDQGQIRTLQLEQGVTDLGDWAFYGCNLTSVTVPESVASIGITAFANCSSLTSIIISLHASGERALADNEAES